MYKFLYEYQDMKDPVTSFTGNPFKCQITFTRTFQFLFTLSVFLYLVSRICYLQNLQSFYLESLELEPYITSPDPD